MVHHYFLRAVIDQWKNDSFSIERSTVRTNVNTCMKLKKYEGKTFLVIQGCHNF